MEQPKMATKFEKSPFYDVIRKGDLARFQNLLNDPATREVEIKDGDEKKAWLSRELEDLQLLDSGNQYGTFLHLAIKSHCAPEIIEGLITHGVPISHRDLERNNFMDLFELHTYPHALQVSHFVSTLILQGLKDGDVQLIKHLIKDTWRHWPMRGNPEIDNFTEAPEYLRHFTMDENIDLDIWLENDAKRVDLYDNRVHVCKLSSLHIWALVNPTGVITSLKELDLLQVEGIPKQLREDEIFFFLKEYNPVLYHTDVMQRTPIHYLCGHKLGDNEEFVRALIRQFKLGDEKDKKGYNASDYLDGKATIQVDNIRKMFQAIVSFSEFSGEEYEEILTRKSGFTGFMQDRFSKLGHGPIRWKFNDGSGRNCLHKAVIYDNRYLLQEIVNIDSTGEIRLSKDAWGRTAMHYAHMLKNDIAKNILSTIKVKRDKQIVPKMSARDYAGKRPEDYGYLNDVSTAKKLRENLMCMCDMLHKFHKVYFGGHNYPKKHIAKELPWTLENTTGKSRLTEMIDHNNKILTLINLRENDDVFYATDALGNRCLDYFELESETYDGKVKEFSEKVQEYTSQRMENVFDNYIKRNKSIFIPKSWSEPYKEMPNFESSRVTAITNPDRPKTGYIEQLLTTSKEQTSKDEGDEMLLNMEQKANSAGVKANAPLDNTKTTNTSVDNTIQAALDNTPPLDTGYLKQALGDTLAQALAEVTMQRPADPIEYLGQYLLKQVHNKEYLKKQQADQKQIKLARENEAKEEQNNEILKAEQSILQVPPSTQVPAQTLGTQVPGHTLNSNTESGAMETILEIA